MPDQSLPLDAEQAVRDRYAAGPAAPEAALCCPVPAEVIEKDYGYDPYAGLFERIEPRVPVPLADAAPFNCARTPLRGPRETKGAAYDAAAVGRCC